MQYALGLGFDPWRARCFGFVWEEKRIWDEDAHMKESGEKETML